MPTITDNPENRYRYNPLIDSPDDLHPSPLHAADTLDHVRSALRVLEEAAGTIGDSWTTKAPFGLWCLLRVCGDALSFESQRLTGDYRDPDDDEADDVPVPDAPATVAAASDPTTD